MTRQTVVSTDLKSVGYDRQTFLLELEFHKGGGVYQYSQIPEDVYAELMASSSKGRYFNSSIKNRYDCQKVA